MDYEGWRTHLDEFCRRSSRSQARTVARFESHFEDLRANADQARAGPTPVAWLVVDGRASAARLSTHMRR